MFNDKDLINSQGKIYSKKHGLFGKRNKKGIEKTLNNVGEGIFDFSRSLLKLGVIVGLGYLTFQAGRAWERAYYSPKKAVATKYNDLIIDNKYILIYNSNLTTQNKVVFTDYNLDSDSNLK